MLATLPNAHAAAAVVATPVGLLQAPTHSWKALRDEHVVEQHRDYACGAASIATLPNGFFGQMVTEAEILEMWDTRDDAALNGKILAILPDDDAMVVSEDCFTNRVFRRTGLAELLLSLRGR
ncbi:MAG TPA: hypothetical protein PL143_06905 [Rhodocyclaceae bacterium]|nr:hypothetical protein [Rhodocyclaceae bacterium]